MANNKNLFKEFRLVVIAVYAICLAIVFFRQDLFAIQKVHQADVIYIDDMKRIKKQLEMSPAVFLHDQHTQALSEQDCNICHDISNREQPFAFLPYKEGMTPKEVEDAYHKMCIGCHLEREGKGLTFGPLIGQCRDCHISDPKYIPADKHISIQSKFFHFIHVYSDEIQYPGSKKNCGVCHHGYDPKLRKLVWKKGSEDACSTCHGKQEKDGRPSLEVASHNTCVRCHFDLFTKAKAENKIFNGPLTCAKCHTDQIHIDTPVDKIPRLMRGQPNVTVLLPVTERTHSTLSTADPGMKPVLFDHKAHEAVVDSCHACHHIQIGSCTQCHTVEGKQRGNFITLSEAMHSKDSTYSCIGCHQKYTMEQEACVVCHVNIKPMQLNSCTTCHTDVKGISLKQIADGSAFNISQKKLGSIALANFKKKKYPVKPLDPSKIPDIVTISVLSKEYEPSSMPHRKIYEALLKGIEKSGLAETFHTTPTTVCAACHHHSPIAELRNPPKCSDCHSAQADKLAVDENKPSLKAAYHQQCMACHEQMQVKPIATDCSGCHIPIPKQ